MAKIPENDKPAALLLAPHGRDSQVAEFLLRDAGIRSITAVDLDKFAKSLTDEIGFALVTEEVLRSSNLRLIAEWVNGQPSWSDLPFLILTHRGGGPERNPAAARWSEVLGNVTFIERPFHPTTFVSVAQTALKARRRQYDARSRINELHEGERRLQIALLAGRLGTWELDLGSLEFSPSPECKAIFGRSSEESLDYESAVDAIHPEDKPRILDAIRQTTLTGIDYAVEHRIIWPDGTEHWGEFRGRRTEDGFNSSIRLIGVASDISSRKAADAELHALNATLEERVLERTSELNKAHEKLLEEVDQRERAEDQLRQLQKMEAIGQLTGGIAHDFNNLLMAVMGNLDLLRKHSLGDVRASRLIGGAMEGARRGAALTQRLLAFARKQDLKVEPIDMAELVEGMRDLIERSIGSTVELQLDLPLGLPRALVDGNQLELALLNLVVNARDSMPEGGSLSIKLRSVEASSLDFASGSFLCLSVTDTGAGMDDETLEKAVDPFFSTKELGKGTGLGLSMVHGLAVQLKGMLKLKSTLGSGTTAELWLPATTRAQEETMVESAVDGGNSMKAVILVVDDDALIAMSTVDMLEDLGHEVIEANSGTQALKIISESPQIDLLITDYSMPGMTGAQLAQAASALLPNLPIILATGYADLPNGTQIDVPRLAKPYTQDQLATAVSKAINKSLT